MCSEFYRGIILGFVLCLCCILVYLIMTLIIYHYKKKYVFKVGKYKSVLGYFISDNKDEKDLSERDYKFYMEFQELSELQKEVFMSQINNRLDVKENIVIATFNNNSGGLV